MNRELQRTEGRYLNTNSKGERLPARGKADAFIADGAEEIYMPTTWPKHLAPALVVVVSNHGFDAALHVADEYQFRRVLFAKMSGDPRPTRWLLHHQAAEIAKPTRWDESSAHAPARPPQNDVPAAMSTKCLQRPCATCPFSRTVTPGTLGGSPVETYIGQVVGPFWLPCHSAYKPGLSAKEQPFSEVQQCAGAAQFRGNLASNRGEGKGPWPDALHVLPRDTSEVFGTLAEFVAHHKGIPLGDAAWWLAFNPPDKLLAHELSKEEVKIHAVVEGGAV